MSCAMIAFDTSASLSCRISFEVSANLSRLSLQFKHFPLKDIKTVLQ